MKCVVCREETKDEELYISPIGYLCIVCLKRIVNWVENNKDTLHKEIEDKSCKLLVHGEEESID
jgi:hypothetical protein